jgi:hypothetical protein
MDGIFAMILASVKRIVYILGIDQEGYKKMNNRLSVDKY